MDQDIIVKELNGKTFCKMFKQLDMVIINFEEPTLCSLHIFSAVRVCQKEKILLNVSDEFFTKNGKPKTEKQYQLLKDKGFINDPYSLFAKNIKTVNKLLNNKQVVAVKKTKWHDIILFFENDIEVQIIQDCLQKDFEYYRFIKFIPYYDDKLNDHKSVHYVVKNAKGIPLLTKEN